MATIKVNKIEAARRQIDTAIRLLFDNEDPIAIHTLSMAGFRILRDLAKKQNSNLNKLVQSFIKPGMDGKFCGAGGQIFTIDKFLLLLFLEQAFL